MKRHVKTGSSHQAGGWRFIRPVSPSTAYGSVAPLAKRTHLRVALCRSRVRGLAIYAIHLLVLLRLRRRRFHLLRYTVFRSRNHAAHRTSEAILFGEDIRNIMIVLLGFQRLSCHANKVMRRALVLLLGCAVVLCLPAHSEVPPVLPASDSTSGHIPAQTPLESESLSADLNADSFNFKLRELRGTELAKIGRISNVIRDAQGFMWFGGDSGLARYDGHSYVIFKHEEKNTNSISSNFVTSFFVDESGALWVATFAGLNRYNAEQGNFTRVILDPTSARPFKIWSISKRRYGGFWLGFEQDGFAYYDPVEQLFKHFPFQGPEHNRLVANSVVDLFERANGDLWLTTYSGTSRYNIYNKKYTNYKHSEDDPASISSDRGKTVFEDSEGTVWIGTNRGLNRYVPETDSFVRYFSDANDESAAGYWVSKIAQDHKQRLWVLTNGMFMLYDRENDTFVHFADATKGLVSAEQRVAQTFYFSPSDDHWVGYFPSGAAIADRFAGVFNVYTRNKEDANSLSHNSINAIELAEDGGLWIGTEDGLNHLDLNSGQVTRYLHDPADLSTIGARAVISILTDAEKNLWVGTWEGGLSLFDRQNNNFIRFQNNAGQNTGLPNNQIWSLYPGPDNTILVGTAMGVSRFYPTLRQFTRFQIKGVDESALGITWAMKDAADGQLWLASGRKTLLIDKDTASVAEQMNEGVLSQLKTTRSRDIHVGKDGSVWLGADGLIKISPDKKNLSHFKKNDGLTDGAVVSIVEDNSGVFWLGTDSGLARYMPATESFMIFAREHGLPFDSFHRNAALLLDDGRVAMGSPGGLIIFDPEKLNKEPPPPRTVLTELRVLNEKVLPGDEDSPLQSVINLATQITLRPGQNIFSLEYSSLEYLLAERAVYSYRMSGFNDNWQLVGNQRLATYTNLDAGRYVFEVKARIDQGAWGDTARITVQVLPAWWATWWATVLYLVILLCCFYWFVRHQRQKLQRELVVVKRLRELDKLKDEFLANTSHELRTPLHGIIGLAESMAEGAAGNLGDNANKNLVMIANSGRRLNKLVDDILDFSRMRSMGYKLEISPVSLFEVAEQVISLSRPLVGGKHLQLTNRINEDTPKVQADLNRLQQILLNLIGNAIKFTDSGKITLFATSENDEVWVHVADTGIGIPTEKHIAIFNMFEQGEGSDTRNHNGTGLGLAVTRGLVEAHGGRIEVESEPSVGSVFRFSLKLAENATEFQNRQAMKSEWPIAVFRSDKLMGSDEQPDEARTDEQTITRALESAKPAHQFSSGRLASDMRILVVDDEPVNRLVLQSYLELSHYQVSAVESGLAALELFKESEHFDVVLLDVMMPRMSGFEVCSALRKKYRAEQLPIIFLTAKTASADLIRGFEVGGNDYLHKPTDRGELLARVQLHLELLETNRHLEEKVNERTERLNDEHSKLKLAQVKLVQAEKMSSLSALVAGITQEFGNPLSFLKMGSCNLESEMKQVQTLIEDLLTENRDKANLALAFKNHFAALFNSLTTLNDGSARISTLVSELHLFSNFGTEIYEPLPVSRLLKSCVSLAETNYGAAADIDVDVDTNCLITCNIPSLNQAFINIINNAYQAINTRIASEPEFAKGRISITSKSADKRIVITFKDNGCGMDQEVMDKIFDPFFSDKPIGQGIGLGLSIACIAIENEGGRIRASSTLGEGAEIVVELPCEFI